MRRDGGEQGIPTAGSAGWSRRRQGPSQRCGSRLLWTEANDVKERKVVSAGLIDVVGQHLIPDILFLYFLDTSGSSLSPLPKVGSSMGRREVHQSLDSICKTR